MKKTTVILCFLNALALLYIGRSYFDKFFSTAKPSLPIILYRSPSSGNQVVLNSSDFEGIKTIGTRKYFPYNSAKNTHNIVKWYQTYPSGTIFTPDMFLSEFKTTLENAKKWIDKLNAWTKVILNF